MSGNFEIFTFSSELHQINLLMPSLLPGINMLTIKSLRQKNKIYYLTINNKVFK